MSEQDLKVSLESAVLAFIPIWSETGGPTAVEDWRKYYGRLCRLFVAGAGTESFPTIWMRRARRWKRS